VFDLLDWAQRFIATPSVSRDGNAAIAALAAEMLRAAGLEPQLEAVDLDGVEHFLLTADRAPARSGADRARASEPGLILLTHLDTVPPGDLRAWTATDGDPFRPTRRGDALFGLGSADAKVDLVCKAAALSDLDLDRLCRPLRIVGTFAEEIGLVGARHFVSQGGTRGFGYALVGEPSELVGIRAHKGYAVFEAVVPLRAIDAGEAPSHVLELEGETAHSSTPHLGRNAIECALERLAEADVAGLRGLDGGGAVNVVPASASVSYVRKSELGVSTQGEWRVREGETATYDPGPLVAFHRAWRARLEALESPRDADFDPDFTVGNLGHVELREGCCVFRFDLRPVPGVDLERAVRPLEAYARITLVRRNPSLATPPDGTLVRAVERAQRAVGLAPRIATKATCTEAGLLAEAGGLEVIVLGAGVSVGNVHRPNECTSVSQLEQARALYRTLVQDLCLEAV